MLFHLERGADGWIDKSSAPKAETVLEIAFGGIFSIWILCISFSYIPIYYKEKADSAVGAGDICSFGDHS